jgi:hypothetical protein
MMALAGVNHTVTELDPFNYANTDIYRVFGQCTCRMVCSQIQQTIAHIVHMKQVHYETCALKDRSTQTRYRRTIKLEAGVLKTCEFNNKGTQTQYVIQVSQYNVFTFVTQSGVEPTVLIRDSNSIAQHIHTMMLMCQ